MIRWVFTDEPDHAVTKFRTSNQTVIKAARKAGLEVTADERESKRLGKEAVIITTRTSSDRAIVYDWLEKAERYG